MTLKNLEKYCKASGKFKKIDFERYTADTKAIKTTIWTKIITQYIRVFKKYRGPTDPRARMSLKHCKILLTSIMHDMGYGAHITSKRWGAILCLLDQMGYSTYKQGHHIYLVQNC